jgi:predicted HicB family RNase H-like nuclease
MAKQFSLKDSLQKKASENPAAAEVEAEASGQPETKRLNVNVPAPLYERFKTQAESEGRSLTWLVTQWIEEYLEG